MYDEQTNNNQNKIENITNTYYNYNKNMINGGNYFKGKKNYYGKKFKKNKDKKNYYNNMNYNNNTMKNQNRNINLNEYNEYMVNSDNCNYNINNNNYEDSKLSISLTNNSTIDTLSNKPGINSDYKSEYNNKPNNFLFKNNELNSYNNNRIQKFKQFKNNQYLRNKNGYYNYTNRNVFINKNINYLNNNAIDNYMDSNSINKFNINNSLNNINNFYKNTNFNNNQNFIPNMNFNIINNNDNQYINQNQNLNINNNIYNNNLSNINLNYNSNNEFLNINKTNQIDMNKKKEKDIIFKKLNLNIKLGEKNLDKEIIIDIDNNNLSLLVNDILKENNLDENYFEPLLNIIEKSVDILINFDKINPSKYAIKNLEENKNILEENNNDIDDSLILDLIDNKNYKEYCDDALSDINFIKMKKERNFSYSYKKQKIK